MTIRSGYGLEPLHLRQLGSELELRFGAPRRKRRSGAVREYWFYPDLGFECILSRRSHRILSIFLHPGAADCGGLPLGDASLLFGHTSPEIRTIFGEPDLEGGGFRLSDGTWIGQWFSYETGMGFHFNEAQKLETVSIFARKRKVRTKSLASASVSARSASRIAAFQRS